MTRGGARAGAGRPAKDTVIYYRRVKPEWVEVLDAELNKLKGNKMKTLELKEVKEFVSSMDYTTIKDELRKYNQEVVDEYEADADTLITYYFNNPEAYEE